MSDRNVSFADYLRGDINQYEDERCRHEVDSRIDGKKHGFERIWFKTDGMYSETGYDNGIRHGVSRIYQNGVLVSEINYANGKVNGSLRTWYYNGSPRTEAVYQNDECVSHKDF
jgi:antitoxin component YwqK of YwqJK toxin-antitoxin module